MKKILSLIAGVSLSMAVHAQENLVSKEHGFVHGTSKEYVWPTEPEVLEKLDQWQDQKFGIMFHWGVYSVPGISESWALCSEDKFTEISRSGIGDLRTLSTRRSLNRPNGRQL